MENKQLIAYLQSVLDWNMEILDYDKGNIQPGMQIKKSYHGNGMANGIKALIALLEAEK